jgi:vacuolar-type H+-ATPase subunit E/Vma4
MQVIGNIGKLKDDIKRSYALKLDEFKKEEKKKFEEKKKAILEEHEKDLRKAEAMLKEAQLKVFKTTFSEELLNAKKEFEKKREELIESAFSSAQEKLDHMISTKEYIDKIKSFAKEKKMYEVTGNLEHYKDYFPDLKLNNKVKGLIIKQKNSLFDFTYTTFMESRKLDLRHKIADILFENVS